MSSNQEAGNTPQNRPLASRATPQLIWRVISFGAPSCTRYTSNELLRN
uniref:Uncharacterized protein n=1 Tax=Anguilla anguilla TaxID=7936 RepID=A0A0E9XF06_ANGAN